MGPRSYIQGLIPVLLVLIASAVACARRAGEVEVAATREAVATAAPIPATTRMRVATPTTAALIPTAMPTVTLTRPARTPTQTQHPPTPLPGPLSGEALVAALRGGGYVIFFRHAATDPVPDDAVPVTLADCSTQRNLSTAGREQASEIGAAIERLGIPIGRVLASPFCRALDTARLAFGKVESEAGLENLETSASEAERQARVEALRGLLARPPAGGTNDVLVGHGFNISAAAEVSLAEGEAAIFRPEEEGGFSLVATVEADEW